MALTTYILLSAVISRPEGIFDPKILGSSASTAFALLCIDLGAIKLGCYLLAIVDEGTVIDLVAYEGYKFVGFVDFYSTASTVPRALMYIPLRT
jgi:hypothetical protein